MDAIDEYAYVVSRIFGIYMDSITGYYMIRESLEKLQGKAIELLKESYPELADINYLDTAPFMYGEGAPGEANSTVWYISTQQDAKLHNSPGGLNPDFAGSMALVLVFHYWEEHYRSEIAHLLGMKQQELTEPIMGDLRRLRNSIIHNLGEAS